MTDKQLERRLAQALSAAAPDDLEGVLSRCEARKGIVIPMKRKTGARMVRNLVAACLALVLVGGGGAYYYQANAVASVVSLDVNPSIELKVNQKEKVLSATPMNEDGAALLEGMELKGTQADVAMYAIIGALLQHGYVDELANSILITVEDEDTQRGEKLQQELTAQADAALANAQVNGAILSQTLQMSSQLSAKAEEYGISAGKAALIQTIVDGSNGTKTFESLVGLSINELNLLYSSMNQAVVDQTQGGNGTGADSSSAGSVPTTPSTNIVTSGSASQSAYIGLEAAKQAALNHAGLSASDVTFLEAEYDYDGGRMVYEVEFRSAGQEYEYEVDALTGEIIKYETDASHSYGGAATVPSGDLIGEEAAKQAALNHAGVKQSDTQYCNAWLEYDDGRPECYEVEFMAGSTRYEYEIALTSSTVLKFESKNMGGQTSASGGGASNPGSQTATGGNGTSGGGTAGDIGSQAAKQAALTHAGISESQTTSMKLERDYDDGRLEDEVEFKSGGMEYEYKIDGSTGTILEYDQDWDD